MSNVREINRIGLQLLVEAAQVLLEETDLQKLLPRLLDKAFEIGEAQRGYILLRDKKGYLVPSLSRGIEPGSIPQGDPSQSVIETAIRERRPIVSRNASRDPRFGGANSLIIRGIRSACCIPLEARGNSLGALYLDTTGTGRLTEDELPLLEAFGSLAGLALAPALELDETKRTLRETSGSSRFPGIIGESEPMRQMYNRLERIAAADLPVLITGESGTGKELVARAIHRIGPRSDGPFRAIFCGNLTSELMESELFGYKKGAFTGAVSDKPGLLDIADKGFLFLDEIVDVPPTIQAKLLRFLQDGEYQRLGDPQPRRADVRVISATNKIVSTEIEAGNFREDLYYRLNVLAIELPPLRDREGDIPLLTATILTRIASRTGQPQRRISPAALDKLSSYTWRGNVRELENVLARSAVLAAGDIIEPEDIDLPTDNSGGMGQVGKTTENLILQDFTDAHILNVLRKCGGNRSEASRKLGVSRRFLQKTLAKWREDGQHDISDLI